MLHGVGTKKCGKRFNGLYDVPDLFHARVETTAPVLLHFKEALVGLK